MLDTTKLQASPEVKDLIRSRGLLLVARTSGSSGQQAYRASVSDLVLAARNLDRIGLAVSDLLPGEQELTELLRGAQPERSQTADGVRFTNRFVELDLRDHGLYVLLSAGTGNKLDVSATQPFVRRLCDVLLRVTPGLLFSRRTDRLARNMLAVAPALTVVQQLGAWIGDQRYGLRALDTNQALLTLMNAGTAQGEVDKLPTQTREGMSKRTGNTMVNGRVPYAVAAVPPPGFVRVRMMSASGGDGDCYLMLDSSKYLPSESMVTRALPRVYDQSGQRVDQVENVRWALSHLYRPGYSVLKVAAGLAARHYATDSRRLQDGPAATWQVPTTATQARTVIRSMLNNLDVYETGVLRLGLGVDGVDDLRIEGLTPPDGPWATSEDFARIRQAHAQFLADRTRARRLCLTGVAVRAGAASGRLRKASSSREGDHYEVGPRPGEAGRSRGAGLTIPHAALAESIVESLASAGASALADLLDGSDAGDATLEDELSNAQHVLRAQESRRDVILEQLSAVGPDGKLIVTGQLLADANDQYTKLVEEVLPQARLAVERARVTIETDQHRRAKEREGVAASALLRLVASLREGTDVTYADLWPKALRDLSIHQEPLRVDGLLGKRLTWTASLVITDAPGTAGVPISGSFIQKRTYTRRVRPDQKRLPSAYASIEELVHLLVAGTPLSQITPSVPHRQVRELAQHWGKTARTLPLISCTDGRLTATAATILESPHLPDDVLARQLNEPVALIARSRQVHASANASAWLRRAATIRATAHRVAAANGGVASRENLQAVIPSTWAAIRASMVGHENDWGLHDRSTLLVLPCAHCASVDLAPMRIPEASGAVCQTCRRDRLGLVWDAETYDRYLSSPARPWPGPPVRRDDPSL